MRPFPSYSSPVATGHAAPAAAAAKAKKFVLNLPPGYHFRPTDDELVVHYLRRKLAGLPLPLPIFHDADVNVCRPDQLIEQYREYGEDRWFFFTKRTRRYEKGIRPVRTTQRNGCWRATGCQRIVYTGGDTVIGRVRTLVYYVEPAGPRRAKRDEDIVKRADKFDITEWTMYEFESVTSKEEALDRNIDKLHEWVLCTIQKKRNGADGRKEGKTKRKKKAGQETSTAAGNDGCTRSEEDAVQVKEGSPAASNVEGDGGGKKRKRKPPVKAQNGIDKPTRRQAAGRRANIPPAPTPPPPQEPQHFQHEVDNFNMEYNIETSAPLQELPQPHSEMTLTPFGDGYNFGPNIGTMQHQYSGDGHPMPRSSPAPITFTAPQELPQSLSFLEMMTSQPQQHAVAASTFTSSISWLSESHGSSTNNNFANEGGGAGTSIPGSHSLLSYELHYPFMSGNSYQQPYYLQHHNHSTALPSGAQASGQHYPVVAQHASAMDQFSSSYGYANNGAFDGPCSNGVVQYNQERFAAVPMFPYGGGGGGGTLFAPAS